MTFPSFESEPGGRSSIAPLSFTQRRASSQPGRRR